MCVFSLNKNFSAKFDKDILKFKGEGGGAGFIDLGIIPNSFLSAYLHNLNILKVSWGPVLNMSRF